VEVRLAPLYDLVSTVYYPELSVEMAMRIGGEYSAEKVTLRDFDELAGDAGLGKALVRARLSEVTGRVMEVLPKVPVRDRVAEEVAELIRQRCETALARFRRGR
jgi:serine/threonine-protein kinase HipA